MTFKQAAFDARGKQVLAMSAATQGMLKKPLAGQHVAVLTSSYGPNVHPLSCLRKGPACYAALAAAVQAAQAAWSRPHSV